MKKQYKQTQLSRAKCIVLRKGLTKRLAAGLICASLTSVVGISAVNAQARDTNVENEQREEIKLNFQDVDIRVLINTVAEVSGKNFIVDPRVKGKVSVISGKSVSPDELYDYFLAILEVHNFATVGNDKVIKILPSNVIKQKPTTTLFQPSEQDNDEQITQIIQLQHAAVQDLVPIVRPLIPPTSHFAQHSASNSVILTDTAANIQRVLKIIRRIDIPDKRSNTHVVYLDKAKASEMANSLTQLIASTSDPKDAAAGGSKLSIQAFDAINALVISATDEQFSRVKALVDELDVERDLAGDVNVISLKYAKAEDLVSILNDVTASNTQGAATDFNVQADESSNSLIVKASGGQLKTVESVVEKLDKRRAQVFVETIIAEVSLNQDGRLGVTWGAGVDAPVVGTGDDAVSDTRQNTVGSISGTGQSETLFSNLATAAGFNYRLFDFGKYQLDVVLNALRSDTNSNVLSTPTILTLDNEEAEIIVGQEVPFVTGVFNNGLTNTNNDGTTGNTGSAVGSGFQTIERKDVGIKLKIKPQINEGDTIQLEVFQETSSVANTVVQGQADLITNRRSIEAVVQVDDGQVVALGGLITDDVTDTEEWVPFLGKLPVVGYLFRSKSKSAVKRNLMVFLKPRIVRTPSDLAKYSKNKYNEVRRDGIIYANKTDDALVLPSVEAPILVEYDESLNDGTIGTEARKRGTQKGDPKTSVQRRVKDIIFGRKRAKTLNNPSTNFSTDGAIETVDQNQDYQLNTKDNKVDQAKVDQTKIDQTRVENILQQIDQKERQSTGAVFDISGNSSGSGQ